MNIFFLKIEKQIIFLFYEKKIEIHLYFFIKAHISCNNSFIYLFYFSFSKILKISLKALNKVDNFNFIIMMKF